MKFHEGIGRSKKWDCRMSCQQRDTADLAMTLRCASDSDEAFPLSAAASSPVPSPEFSGSGPPPLAVYGMSHKDEAECRVYCGKSDLLNQEKTFQFQYLTHHL